MAYRILLFDDDYESMDPLKGELEERGYLVDLTAAKEVLAQLSTNRYDLICVDFMIHLQSPGRDTDSVIDNVHYPEVNWQKTGQEFLARLRGGEYEGSNGRGTPRTVPAIIISATAEPDENYGAVVNFEKPFDIEEVLLSIDAQRRG